MDKTYLGWKFGFYRHDIDLKLLLPASDITNLVNFLVASTLQLLCADFAISEERLGFKINS
jgi:hypothetical protein